jgi:hypothetical protein
MWGISWLAANQLAAQERLCAMEWVSKYVSNRRPLGRPRRRWVDNIRMDLQQVGCRYMDWIGLAQDRDRWRTLVSEVMNLGVPWNAGNFLTSCKPISCSSCTLHRAVSKYIIISIIHKSQQFKRSGYTTCCHVPRAASKSMHNNGCVPLTLTQQKSSTPLA